MFFYCFGSKRDNIAGVHSARAYEQAFTAQHASGHLFAQRFNLSPADKGVHPPQIKWGMLAGSTGGSAASAGKAQPEAGLAKGNIIPHQPVRGIIIDQPAAVDGEPEFITCTSVHRVVRYLTVSVTAALACEIVSVMFIGAVHVPA